MKQYNRINFLNDHYDKIYCIHYSCQNLNDENEGYSPRITSIAIMHMASNQMTSFSMHLIAEELHIDRQSIIDKYDEIERIMLSEFFDFVSSKGNEALWLHWNMRNINFGFETLEHRYRVLTGKKPFHIAEETRFNLSTLISKKYGYNYADDPKMLNLMLMNGGKHRDFLTGEEEVTAFKANEFVKMHSSTMCKVNFFKLAFGKMCNNKLKTNTNKLRYKVNQIYQNPIIQILGVVGVFGTLASLVVMIIQNR